MLDLGLRELAHAQQPLPRRDLVTVRLPDLRRRKRQLAAVKVQQVPAESAAIHLTRNEIRHAQSSNACLYLQRMLDTRRKERHERRT